MENRISILEDDKHNFVKKDRLKEYVRCDICDKNIAHVNMANSLKENLNAERITVLDDKVEAIETQVKTLRRILIQIKDRIMGK